MKIIRQTSSQGRRVVRQITDNRFVNLKEVVDPKKGVQGFQFAERLGVDSVAFICFDEKSQEFLLNKEYKVPIDDFLLGAFGGSLDKDKSKDQIVVEEVKEEAGYKVTEKDIHYLGKMYVSTQMNQFCHLYLVMVDKDQEQEKEPENEVEAAATTEWVDWKKLLAADDWKSLAIFTKAYIINSILPDIEGIDQLCAPKK